MYNIVGMIRFLWILIAVIVLSFNAMANNVRIKGEVKLQAYNESTALISFPLSWEHSWRESENWDAVWIFVKYKRVGVNEPWHHAYLKEKGHKVAGRDDIPPMEFLPVYTKEYWPLRYNTLKLGNAQENTVGTDRNVIPGLFMFRKKVGTGDINIPRVSLEWNFKEGDMSLYYDVTLDDIRKGKIEVSVQAVEMVYVPVGPYYLGDRSSAYSFVNQAVDAGILVTSENEQKFYTMGRYAASASEKAWIVPEKYPKGYTGYYTMKYEVSQEQYVNFLNRLTLRDQKIRIGRDLLTLNPGDYVFGEGANKEEPSYRNGIVLVEKFTPIDTPAVFGFNLNELTPPNFPDDGKSVACNFLTPEDLRAYLDWIGLRPHSEMEFEKGCRERNPRMFFADRSFAWGTPVSNELKWSDVTNLGEENEKVINGKNVNGPYTSSYPAPVKCGAFASGTSGMIDAGASKWGLMEMTGNLAEICYNAEGGKDFRGDIFGDGNIWSTVSTWKEDSVLKLERMVGTGGIHPETKIRFSRRIEYPAMSKLGKQMDCLIEHDVEYQYCYLVRNVYDDEGRYIGRVLGTELVVPFPTISWPDTVTAIGLKGGSFNDDNKDAMSVSYRGTVDAFVDCGLDTRLKYVGFRGGRTVPIRTIVSGVVAGENRTSRDTAVVCPGNFYTISEIVEGEDDPTSTIYFWEINDGSGWREISGKQDKDLVLDWIVNDSVPWKEYQFRRHSIASHAESYSNVVTLCVPGRKVSGVDGVLTMGMYDEFINMFVELKGQADVVQVYWLKSTTNNWEPFTPLTNVSGVQQIELNRHRFDPPITYGDNGNVDIRTTVTIGGCILETNSRLEMSRYAYVTPAGPIVDDRDGKRYNTTALADNRPWMTDDLDYDVPAGNNGGFSWPAATGGNYTLSHILANAAGKLQLCPTGYEVPLDVDWDNLLFMYGDGQVDGGNLPCYDPGSKALYDPALSNLINGLFNVTTGSAGFNQNSGMWWAADQHLYGFGDFFGLFFGHGDVDMNDYDATYKIRCVKKK